MVDATGHAGARLLVFWDGGFQAKNLVPGDVIAVGRSRECEVQIDHPSVSRRHVAVHATEPVLIEDLGSSNGTRVGDIRIPPHAATPLPTGQIAQIGIAMLVVQRGGRTASSPTEAAGTPTLVPSAAPPGTADSPMQRLERLVELVAGSEISVIVLGETGVGKEVVSETLHRRSPRAGKPFVMLNCAALSESLLESELFGHERGAFTGAVRDKPGLVEAANGGTLLLDEVGEMPLGVQAKLLRVVEMREATRLGSVVPRRIDVRFVAATNRDLEALVDSGAFRRDLYFRLNGITLTIPPLRERRDEIAPLARQFAAEARTRAGRAARPDVVIDAAAIVLLERYDWPGNVRELRALIERAVLLAAGGPVLVDHLPADAMSKSIRRIASAAVPESELEVERERLDREQANLERQRVIQALERAGGNQTRAAKLLGMSRRTLVSRIEEFDLPRPRKR